MSNVGSTTSPTTLTAATWYHTCVTVVGSTTTLYLNGKYKYAYGVGAVQKPLRTCYLGTGTNTFTNHTPVLSSRPYVYLSALYDATLVAGTVLVLGYGYTTVREPIGDSNWGRVEILAPHRAHVPGHDVVSRM